MINDVSMSYNNLQLNNIQVWISFSSKFISLKLIYFN